jgi:hypothetical protein
MHFPREGLVKITVLEKFSSVSAVFKHLYCRAPIAKYQVLYQETGTGIFGFGRFSEFRFEKALGLAFALVAPVEKHN